MQITKLISEPKSATNTSPGDVVYNDVQFKEKTPTRLCVKVLKYVRMFLLCLGTDHTCILYL